MPFPKNLSRFVRRLLLSVAIATTLVVGAIVVENWRGERAWKAYCAQRAAGGDPVDTFPVPSSLPDERNFMKTPVLDRLLYAPDGSSQLAEFEKTVNGLKAAAVASYPWRSGAMIDFSDAGVWASRGKDPSASRISQRVGADLILAEHSMEMPALFLEALRLAALARSDSEVVHPVALSERSLSGFPLPRFPVVRSVARVLAVDACASLAAERYDQAWRDTMAAAQLTRGFAATPDPTLVEAMVVGALINVVVQSVWEAPTHGRWSDPQWSQLQLLFGEIEPVDSLRRSFRISRVHTAGVLQNTPVKTLLSDEMQWENPLPRWAVALHVLPGWIQRNKIAAVEDMDVRLSVIASRGTPGFLPALMEDRERRRESRGRATPWTVLAPAYSAGYEKVTDLVLVAKNNIVLVRSVCALERFRLAHGGYPNSLSELVPEFLGAVPCDLVDGEPLRYRRNGDGTFLLYSIGIDGKDDGGRVALWDNQGRNAGCDGDWVWPRLAE